MTNWDRAFFSKYIRKELEQVKLNKQRERKIRNWDRVISIVILFGRTLSRILSIGIIMILFFVAVCFVFKFVYKLGN